MLLVYWIYPLYSNDFLNFCYLYHIVFQFCDGKNCVVLNIVQMRSTNTAVSRRLEIQNYYYLNMRTSELKPIM